MRTDVRVSGNMVLAIVLGDIADHLTHPPVTIRKALVAERMGETFVVKDFLKGGELGTGIVHGKNSRRRKCDVMYWCKIDADDQDQLRAGKSYTH